jgi:hypothetical protein
MPENPMRLMENGAARRVEVETFGSNSPLDLVI